MGKVPEAVVRRAARLADGGLTAAQAISRALAEHGHRYARPEDYVRTVLDMGAMLGVYAAHPPIGPIVATGQPGPEVFAWELSPLPGQGGRELAPAIARVLERPTGTTQRSSAPASSRCADQRCRHGRGTHAHARIDRRLPCLWGDCPCEDYQGPVPAPRGAAPREARIVRPPQAPAAPPVAPQAPQVPVSATTPIGVPARLATRPTPSERRALWGQVIRRHSVDGPPVSAR